MTSVNVCFHIKKEARDYLEKIAKDHNTTVSNYLKQLVELEIVKDLMKNMNLLDEETPRETVLHRMLSGMLDEK